MLPHERYIQFFAALGYQPVSFGSVRYDNTDHHLYEFIIGDPNKPAILLSAGMHGDEPAGPVSLMSFLSREFEAEYLDTFCFYVYPMWNPSGYDRFHRWNKADQDMNRGFFENSDREECQIIMEHIQSNARDYHLAIDLHESGPDDDGVMAGQGEGDYFEEYPEAYYLYEICPDQSRRTGHKIIAELEKSYPVCKWDKIYGDTNSGGVVSYPEACGNPHYAEAASVDGFLVDQFCQQAFVTESYTGHSIQQRTEEQVLTIKLAIKETLLAMP